MDPIERLVFELSKLPSIGERTATRLAYFILRQEESQVRDLSEALLKAKTSIKLCVQCMNFTDAERCSLCSNPSRQTGIICIVEKPSDVMAIEKSHRFHGRYHVLHGLLSPLDGIGPSQLYIQQLLHRIENEDTQEMILALSSSVEAEATGVYLTKLLKPLGIKVFKIAHGIPVGGVLEYLDQQTIGRAIENRLNSEG